MIEINDLLSRETDSKNHQWRPKKPITGVWMRIFGACMILKGKAVAVYWRKWK